MTTNNIVSYEIIIQLGNKGNGFKQSKQTHKNQVCWGDNTRIFDNPNTNPWLSLRPLQTKSKRVDSPMFAVFEDGSRKKTNTRHFFRCFPEAWLEIKANIDNNDVDDDIYSFLWEEDREERPTTIKLIIPARTIQEVEGCFSTEKIHKNNGNPIRVLEFFGKVEFVHEERANYRPVQFGAHPGFMSDDEYYSKEVTNTTVAAKAAASVTPDVEHVVVDDSSPSLDDLENELFAVSHAKPPAPVGDFSNADLEREATPKKKSNKVW